MATFILVHGTWAKSAHWPELEDGLTEIARAAGDAPLFEKLTWTGRNRVVARQAAASAISNLVKRIQCISVNEKIFIIGHSHGGNAIAYFLKQHQEAAKTLSGCAFLSTPFVAMRPRREATRLFIVLLLFPFITFMSLWNETMKPRTKLSPFEVPFSDIVMDDLAQAPMYIFGIILVALIGRLIWVYFKKASASQKVEQSIREQTADIPAGNYLFLRCSGDEAAAALSAAQFIAWLGIRVASILKFLTRSLFTEGKIGFISWMVLLLVIYDAIAYGFLQVLPDFFRFVIHYPDGSLLGNLSSARLVFALISFVIVSLLLVCLLAVFLIFVTQALTSWAFGWTPLWTGFLVELAIEPLPFGEHSLVHIDWTPNSIGLDGYGHSWTYAHPDAIKHLQNWVRESLEKLNIYCDTDTLLSNIRQDDEKSKRELLALQRLLVGRQAGKYQMVRSRVNLRELTATRNEALRQDLLTDYAALESIANDEKVLGVDTQYDRLGGFVANPMVSDVQDEPLRDGLVKRGLVQRDAEHLAQAISNHCSIFLTRDETTIINPHRDWIEETFPPLKVRLPSELLNEIEPEKKS